MATKPGRKKPSGEEPSRGVTATTTILAALDVLIPVALRGQVTVQTVEGATQVSCYCRARPWQATRKDSVKQHCTGDAHIKGTPVPVAHSWHFLAIRTTLSLQAKCASERSCGSTAGWPHIPATCTHFARIVHFCPFLPQPQTPPQTPCSRMRPGSGLALTRVMMRCSHPVGQGTAKVRARALFRRGQGSRQQPCPCHSLRAVCWLLAPCNPLPRLGYLSCSMPWPPVSVALLFNLKFLPFCEQVAQGPTLLVVGHQASDLSVVPAVQPAVGSCLCMPGGALPWRPHSHAWTPPRPVRPRTSCCRLLMSVGPMALWSRGRCRAAADRPLLSHVRHPASPLPSRTNTSAGVPNALAELHAFIRTLSTRYPIPSSSRARDHTLVVVSADVVECSACLEVRGVSQAIPGAVTREGEVARVPGHMVRSSTRPGGFFNMIEDHVKGTAHVNCLYDFNPSTVKQGRLDMFLKPIVRDEFSLRTKEACRGYRASSVMLNVDGKPISVDPFILIHDLHPGIDASGNTVWYADHRRGGFFSE